MSAGWAVVCDFDGTLTTEDLGDRIAIEFGGYAAWREAEERFAAGELGFGGLIVEIFRTVTAPREVIAAYARDRARLRPGAERFIAACRDAGRPVLVCSGGLDVYVDAVLDRRPPPLRAHVEVRANRAACSPSGLRVTFHAGAPGCGRCGFCKGTVVEELQRRGLLVAVCGDGAGDRCAADRADVVFARATLAAYCRERGLEYTPFETFDEVLAAFPR